MGHEGVVWALWASGRLLEFAVLVALRRAWKWKSGTQQAGLRDGPELSACKKATSAPCTQPLLALEEGGQSGAAECLSLAALMDVHYQRPSWPRVTLPTSTLG